jgi:magnesium-transporting ATPase (P-type)
MNNNFSSGLTQAQVLESQKKFGKNTISKKRFNALKLLVRQFTGNTLIIVLLAASLVSFIFDSSGSSIYIAWMIVISVVMGFWNEFSAERTVDNLLKQISHKATVIRDSKKQEISASDVVIEDLVLISPGDVVCGKSA